MPIDNFYSYTNLFLNVLNDNYNNENYEKVCDLLMHYAMFKTNTYLYYANAIHTSKSNYITLITSMLNHLYESNTLEDITFEEVMRSSSYYGEVCSKYLDSNYLYYNIKLFLKHFVPLLFLYMVHNSMNSNSSEYSKCVTQVMKYYVNKGIER